ncbi:MAG TPA: cobalt transporter, partial [Thermoplasmata archaeon]|nr:cobalt transporter [Thermoplasmata archaeon]
MRLSIIARFAMSTAPGTCCPECRAGSGQKIEGAPDSRRAGQLRQALRLQYLTSGYNIAEGIVAVSAGLAATSVALIGFGFDSGIEVASSAVMIWRFRHERAGRADTPGAEKRASRVIAVTFLLLAAYVGFASVRSLLAAEAPSASMVGIALAVASLIVMPTLTVYKRRLARAM